KTKVFGIVYQPNWAQGLSASVDWYSVEVTNNINQVTAEDVVRGCYVDNDADLCKFITRTGNPSEQDPSIRLISLVGVPYYNQASVKADGVDFEIVYNRNVNWFNGSQVFVRLLGRYLEARSHTNSQGVKTEVQGRFVSRSGRPSSRPAWSGGRFPWISRRGTRASS